MTTRGDLFRAAFALEQEREQLRVTIGKLREMLNEGEPWSLLDTLSSAHQWLDHLAMEHDCDHEGHEQYQQCKSSIALIIPKVKAAIAHLTQEGK